MTIDPDPAFVAQLEENHRIAKEILALAGELMTTANALINHSNLQWAHYSRQLVAAEADEEDEIEGGTYRCLGCGEEYFTSRTYTGKECCEDCAEQPKAKRRKVRIKPVKPISKV